ncbi:MAG: hypothetical protein IPJ88_08470 [Myxococcales bacterium]|nr:MAG: hypothetical protein IPJ88_08470 [Myxococcales bacterium]
MSFFRTSLVVCTLIFLTQACGSSGGNGGIDPNFDAGTTDSDLLNDASADAIATMDTTAPVTTISSKPNSITNETSASFEFSANESNVSFECSLDDAAFSACTSPLELSGLSDGAHTLKIKATDSSDNVEATPAEYSWTVDTAAPETTITASPSNPSNQQIAHFEFSSDDASATFTCSINSFLALHHETSIFQAVARTPSRSPPSMPQAI